MMRNTEFVYLDKDDEYMYFEVFYNGLPEGTIFVKRIIPLRSEKSMNENDKTDWKSLTHSTNPSQSTGGQSGGEQLGGPNTGVAGFGCAGKPSSNGCDDSQRSTSQPPDKQLKEDDADV